MFTSSMRSTEADSLAANFPCFKEGLGHLHSSHVKLLTDWCSEPALRQVSCNWQTGMFETQAPIGLLV